MALVQKVQSSKAWLTIDQLYILQMDRHCLNISASTTVLPVLYVMDRLDFTKLLHGYGRKWLIWMQDCKQAWSR